MHCLVPVLSPLAHVLAASSEDGRESAPPWLPARVEQAWQFPLLDVQGAQITLGSVLTALLILVAGFLLSRLASRMLAWLLARRTGIHPGAIAATRALLTYTLFALVILLALRVAQIPFSLFAVAGGALAIGIGFGSQNILNNFISGLILLIERPIRVGDILQIEALDPVSGVVREIGARSTRIVTGENVEIIVPNSTLLQNSIVNWTLSSDEIRASIGVGVAYGTPLQAARDLMLEAAGDHGLVQKSPAPMVLCEEFGDNAVQLRMYFWMRIRRAFERRLVESDLRFKIEKLFRQHDIVIAFPQRDVYLRAAGPLSVRLTEGRSPDDKGNDSPR